MKKLLVIAGLFLISVTNLYPKSTGKLKEGDTAPEISLPDPNGDTIKLSSFKGKIVLVDFWASWCHPCRMFNPKMIALYKKYHDRKFETGDGFEILSVSLDTDKKDWADAISEDKIPWKTHVSDLKRWQSKTARDYNIAYIPNSCIIDGEGKIIASDLDYSMVKYYLKALVKRK
jgi:thiol-disulfide isomerase/thioredoxin